MQFSSLLIFASPPTPCKISKPAGDFVHRRRHAYPLCLIRQSCAQESIVFLSDAQLPAAHRSPPATSNRRFHFDSVSDKACSAASRAAPVASTTMRQARSTSLTLVAFTSTSGSDRPAGFDIAPVESYSAPVFCAVPISDEWNRSRLRTDDRRNRDTGFTGNRRIRVAGNRDGGATELRSVTQRTNDIRCPPAGRKTHHRIFGGQIEIF